MSGHEHHHDHEHGPDCGCGHHHHHDHECGPDCDCGHHHSEAAGVVEKALVFSREGPVIFSAPRAAEAVLSELAAKIRDIAALVAIDGFVVGHVKALLRSEVGQAGISITRLDSPDLTRLSGWEGQREISRCDLSLAVLSLANTDADVEAACQKLYE